MAYFVVLSLLLKYFSQVFCEALEMCKTGNITIAYKKVLFLK